MNRLDNADNFQLTLLLAKKLVLDLDAEDHSNVDSIAAIMSDMPVELVNVFVRMITLERIVHNSLDEHPTFGPFLAKYLEETKKLEKEIRDESVSTNR